jgi:prepilin-type N-terminal cleavage/methylation domain-containing protein
MGKRGLSLVELIVVVAIAGIATTVITATMNRAQRFYRAANELRSTRESVRDAMEVLSADVRGMSTADTVRFRADSALEFFAQIGVSVVCLTNANEAGLPAVHSSGNSLSAFITEHDTGDVALFYADSSDSSQRWIRYRITSFASHSLGSSCPQASKFSTQAEIAAGDKGFVVGAAAALSSNIKPGAPVRFVRRVRYSLYRASDGYSYLGYRRCNAIGASVCGAVQPISGPYANYSNDARATGLLFEYFDAAGRRLAPSASALALARVDITARSQSAQRNPFSGRDGPISDSATVAIAVRNNVE